VSLHHEERASHHANHDVTAALEDRVKEKFPQIYRVTIHPEPFEEK